VKHQAPQPVFVWCHKRYSFTAVTAIRNFHKVQNTFFNNKCELGHKMPSMLVSCCDALLCLMAGMRTECILRYSIYRNLRVSWLLLKNFIIIFFSYQTRNICSCIHSRAEFVKNSSVRYPLYIQVGEMLIALASCYSSFLSVLLSCFVCEFVLCAVHVCQWV